MPCNKYLEYYAQFLFFSKQVIFVVWFSLSLGNHMCFSYSFDLQGGEVGFSGGVLQITFFLISLYL